MNEEVRLLTLISLRSDWALCSTSISCKEIGEANENQVRGVIITSFNAG